MSVLAFFHVALGSNLPLQRYSILIDFSTGSFVIFAFSSDGANLSDGSKVALSPRTKLKIFFFVIQSIKMNEFKYQQL